MSKAVNLIDPSGQFVNVPDVEVPNALKYGYRLATDKEINHEILKEDYGTGFGNELAAGVEGALSGATFGLSRVGSNIASEILGIEALGSEAQALRKEFNPAASMAGEITGVLGSFALPGGALVGAVSKGTAKAGQVASGLIGNQVAKQLAAKTIGGVIEGMLYGGGQAISEAALGDPTLNAQKVFNQITLGGVLGGGINFATTALGMGAKKAFGKSALGIADDVAKIDDTAQQVDDVTGVATPTRPVELKGEITFDLPDEEILKRAAPLNPDNALKKNDLTWLKKNGMPDADGKPTIFQKIGTKEIPTLDPLAEGQVYMGDAVTEAMEAVGKENQRLAGLRDKILGESDLTISRDAYRGLIQEEIAAIKASGAAGDDIGIQAIRNLNKTLAASKNLPEEMTALQLKDRLDAVRQSGKIYTKSGGLKDDFVSQTYKNFEKKIDNYLKDNIQGYRELMKEYSDFVQKSIDIEDYLDWNFQTKTSDLVSDWVANRVAKPFQSSLPGTKKNAELIRWLGEMGGTDFDTAARANFIFGKLNPKAAQAAQQGTWGSRVVEGLGALSQPTEIPGKLAKGAAKMVLTGEAPEFVVNMRSRGVQDLLLGKTKNQGAVDSILSKFNKLPDSAIFKRLGPAAGPIGVTTALPQFLDSHETVDEADRNIELLMAVEKATIKANRAIESGVKGVFSQKSEKLNVPFKSDGVEDDLLGLLKEVNELRNDPEAMLNRVTESTKGLAEGAPNIAAGVSMAAAQGLGMLSDKLNAMFPQTPMPLDRKFVPSKTQMNSLAKTMHFINNPYDTLKEVAAGTVSVEAKEVLTRVYPDLYLDIKAQLLNELAEQQAKGKSIPATKQLSLSFFTGQPLNSSMQPMSMMANQAAFMAPQSTQQGGMQARSSSAKHLTVSNRMQTPMQKIASR